MFPFLILVALPIALLELLLLLPSPCSSFLLVLLLDSLLLMCDLCLKLAPFIHFSSRGVPMGVPLDVSLD